MKTVIIAMGLTIWLSGCGAPAWETVHDNLPTPTEAVWQESAYEISLGIPDHLQLVEEGNTYALYSSEHGEVEIETSRFLTTGLEQAIEKLSGYSADRMMVLQTQRFELPEYQFAWVSQSEQGTRLYRADLIMDGTCCYAVVCSSLEEAGDYASFEARKVFSTFGLNGVEEI